MKVIRILAAADGTATQLSGLYVQAYNPRANNGVGSLALTSSAQRAKKYVDEAAALAEYQADSGLIRCDGQPSRPLSAYHCAIEDAPEVAK